VDNWGLGFYGERSLLIILYFLLTSVDLCGVEILLTVKKKEAITIC